MKTLLLKLFVKDYKNTSDQKVRSNYGVLAGIFGIVTNLIICSIKIIVGILSMSLSILADGINNLSDAGASIVTFVGFKLSALPADERHPFGHERLEYLSGMIVSIIILMIGATLFIDSVEKFFNPVSIISGTYIYIILGISIVLKIIQALFYRSLSKDIDSTTLKAQSVDSLNDCISTIVVLMGLIIFDLTGFMYIDSIMGVLVSFFIIFSGLGLLKETMNPLIGSTPTEEEINNISKNILSHEGVLGIHDLVIHSYGPNKKFVTVHIEVDRDVDVMLSHDMIDNIESEFKHLYNIDLVCHMDPVDIHDEETIRLKKLIGEILNEYDKRLTFHDFRIVKGVTHTNVVFDVVMPSKYELTPQELKEKLTQKIKEKDSFLIPVICVDHLYDHNE